MKLESLTPLERIAYVANQRLQGSALDPFCVLATISVQQAINPLDPSIQQKLTQILGPVLIMEAFAKAIGDKLRGAGQVYLLGDSTVTSLADEVGFLPEQSWNGHLEMLASTALIFRFPVALKFGYSDPLLTQLRASSWGRLAFQELRLDRLHAFQVTVARIESVIESYEELYEELVSICQSQSRPLDVERIHELNGTVPIPVVT